MSWIYIMPSCLVALGCGIAVYYACRDRPRSLHHAQSGASQTAVGLTSVATAVPVTSTTATASLADELERIGHLHDQGKLTDQEFTLAKDRILSGTS